MLKKLGFALIGLAAVVIVGWFVSGLLPPLSDVFAGKLTPPQKNTLWWVATILGVLLAAMIVFAVIRWMSVHIDKLIGTAAVMLSVFGIITLFSMYQPELAERYYAHGGHGYS